MKASDVIARLANVLPLYTNMFSDNIGITFLSNVAGVATIAAPNHGLAVGDPIVISDVPVPLDISSLTRTGGFGTLVTADDHDLTLKIAPTIKIEGSSQSNFNGVFNVVSIDNRRTIVFVMPNSGAGSATGGKLIDAVRYDQKIVGLKQVASILNANTFTINTGISLTFTTNSGYVKKNIRISGAASIERAIAAYSPQDVERAYLFVVLGNVSASKSRASQSDAIYQLNRGDFFQQFIQEPVSLFVVSSVKDEIAARKIRDEMSDLLIPITKSILFFAFPTNARAGKSFPITFVGHGIFSYDSATYVHQFDFEATSELYFEDTVMFDVDVAFRNIDFFDKPSGDSADKAHTNINLDDK